MRQFRNVGKAFFIRKYKGYEIYRIDTVAEKVKGTKAVGLVLIKRYSIRNVSFRRWMTLKETMLAISFNRI